MIHILVFPIHFRKHLSLVGFLKKSIPIIKGGVCTLRLFFHGERKNLRKECEEVGIHPFACFYHSNSGLGRILVNFYSGLLLESVPWFFPSSWRAFHMTIMSLAVCGCFFILIFCLSFYLFIFSLFLLFFLKWTLCFFFFIGA